MWNVSKSHFLFWHPWNYFVHFIYSLYFFPIYMTFSSWDQELNFFFNIPNLITIHVYVLSWRLSPFPFPSLIIGFMYIYYLPIIYIYYILI